MASLACSRLGGACIGSLACLEPLDAGSTAVSAVLKPPECPSPRLWSVCTVNDRNVSLLGNVSGAAGVEGLRFAAGAHDGGASVCVFQETAQLLQRSEAVRRNHHKGVGEEASALHVDLEGMNDDTASMAFLSVSSNAREDELSSDTSSDASSDAIPSPQRVEGPLDCMTALDEALPVKRGLSRHFAGKSQSFSCLADVRSVADLAKPLNPFVKRRKTDSYLEKEACYRPRSLPASSVSKRPVNSHRKAQPVATVPKFIAPESVHTMQRDSVSTFVPLKCFSSPELGERTRRCF